MVDDLTKRGPPDAIRINKNESWEVRGWAKHFGVSEARLEQAAEAAGPMTKDVRAYLKRMGWIS